jgi:hypothetical protein
VNFAIHFLLNRIVNRSVPFINCRCTLCCDGFLIFGITLNVSCLCHGGHFFFFNAYIVLNTTVDLCLGNLSVPFITADAHCVALVFWLLVYIECPLSVPWWSFYLLINAYIVLQNLILRTISIMTCYYHTISMSMHWTISNLSFWILAQYWLLLWLWCPGTQKILMLSGEQWR